MKRFAHSAVLLLSFGLTVSAADAVALPNVTTNLGVSDINHGLVRVAVADGDTTAATIGGLDSRRPLDPSDDLYMYFAADDSLAYRGSKAYMWVYFHYFDQGPGTLRIQYDSLTDPYKDGPSVALTGTQTWKVYAAEITDAYFGNRQNGGADFRITASTPYAYHVDLAYVRVPGKRLPMIDITPTQFGNGENPGNPATWLELCQNLSSWPSALAQTDGMGYATQHLYPPRVSDSDLQQCFANINAARRKFSPAVGAIKEDCVGAQCFNMHAHEWDRFAALGATMDMFHIDEPFTNWDLYHRGTMTEQQAVEETVAWMQLVRAKYPHIQLVEIEAYPEVQASSLIWWVRELNKVCAANSVPIIDFFQIDHDWNRAGGFVSHVKEIRDAARAQGIPFGLNIWAANKSGEDALETDWHTGVIQQAQMYATAGFVPDLYSLNDWIHTPRQIIPDTQYPSFTYTALDFARRFATRTMVQPDLTDVPNGHPFHDQIFAVARRDVPGCAWDAFCPDAATTRGSMARFLLKAKEGAQYVPPKCMGSAFSDVPCGTEGAIWVNEIYRRGITGGCGGGMYCPSGAVTREQMAVFLLLAKEGSGYVPPACTTPTFADVPCSSPFAKWIEELVRRGITGGCGGGNYCPASVVSRGQMSVFVDTTFGLN